MFVSYFLYEKEARRKNDRPLYIFLLPSFGYMAIFSRLC